MENFIQNATGIWYTINKQIYFTKPEYLENLPKETREVCKGKKGWATTRNGDCEFFDDSIYEQGETIPFEELSKGDAYDVLIDNHHEDNSIYFLELNILDKMPTQYQDLGLGEEAPLPKTASEAIIASELNNIEEYYIKREEDRKVIEWLMETC